MTLMIQAFVVIVCLAFLAFVIRQVGNERFLLKYALLWLALAVLILLCAVFPRPLFYLASFLGFGTASNFIFFVGLFFIIAICLSLTAIVSKQAIRIKNLTQALALFEYEQRKSKEVLKIDCPDRSKSVND